MRAWMTLDISRTLPLMWLQNLTAPTLGTALRCLLSHRPAPAGFNQPWLTPSNIFTVVTPPSRQCNIPTCPVGCLSCPTGTRHQLPGAPCLRLSTLLGVRNPKTRGRHYTLPASRWDPTECKEPS